MSAAVALDFVVLDGIKEAAFLTDIVALGPVCKSFADVNFKRKSQERTKITLIISIQQQNEAADQEDRPIERPSSSSLHDKLRSLCSKGIEFPQHKTTNIQSGIIMKIIERKIDENCRRSAKKFHSNRLITMDRIRPTLDSIVSRLSTLHSLKISTPIAVENERLYCVTVCKTLIAATERQANFQVNNLHFSTPATTKEKDDENYKTELLHHFAPTLRKAGPFHLRRNESGYSPSDDWIFDNEGEVARLALVLESCRLLRSLSIRDAENDAFLNKLNGRAKELTNLRSFEFRAPSWTIYNSSSEPEGPQDNFIRDSFGENENLRKMTFDDCFLSILANPTALPVLNRLASLKLFILFTDMRAFQHDMVAAGQLRKIIAALATSAGLFIHLKMDGFNDHSLSAALRFWYHLTVETDKAIAVHLFAESSRDRALIGARKRMFQDFHERLPDSEAAADARGRFYRRNGNFILMMEEEHAKVVHSPYCTCFNSAHRRAVHSLKWTKVV